MIFGKLEVLSEFKKNGHKFFHCLCECGNYTDVEKSDVVRGHTKSCGCVVPRLKDLSGEIFGKIHVIRRAENKGHKAYWECYCECSPDKTLTIYDYSLRKQETKSCGCMKTERLSKENTYEEKDDYIIGYTENNYKFLIDKDDFERIKKHYWGHDGNGYLKNIHVGAMHRYILSLNGDSPIIVDHINHIRHDNRKCNLRTCTTKENSMNKEKVSNNTSGKIGYFLIGSLISGALLYQ